MLSLCVDIRSYTGTRYMISQIFGILYEIRFILFLSIFVLSYHCLEMHSWGVILVLRLTPNHGPLFVPMKWWHNLWSINLIIVQPCQRPSHNSLCETLHQIQRQSWRLTLRRSRSYLLRLDCCQFIWLISKVTRTPLMIWWSISRIEAVYSKTCDGGGFYLGVCFRLKNHF